MKAVATLHDAEEMNMVLAILRGDPVATGKFSKRFRDDLISWLVSKCDVKDGRSREKAIDVVDELIAECVAGDAAKGKSPLLTKFAGRGSLEGWLRRSARCRLISWWRSLEYRSEQSESSLIASDDDENPLENRLASTTDVHAEEAVAHVLRDGLLFGFKQAEMQEPLGLVFLRLSSLHGIQKQRLAQAWNRDPAQAGRRISKALELIRDGAQDYVRSIDPYLELEWSDYLKVFEQYPRLMHGDTEPA